MRQRLSPRDTTLIDFLPAANGGAPSFDPALFDAELAELA
jgi:hypothetical protein